MTFSANGAEGLNGPIVNNGTLDVLGQVHGTGAITNRGTLDMEPYGDLYATSFTQSAAGRLDLTVYTTGRAFNPEMQLTGEARLAGSLTVDGAVAGPPDTFAFITAARLRGRFAPVSFSGAQQFTLSYTHTTLTLATPSGT